MRFVKFTDTFEKRDSRRCLARVNPLRIVSMVISVNYNNEIISEKSRQITLNIKNIHKFVRAMAIAYLIRRSILQLDITAI